MNHKNGHGTAFVVFELDVFLDLFLVDLNDFSKGFRSTIGLRQGRPPFGL